MSASTTLYATPLVIPSRSFVGLVWQRLASVWVWALRAAFGCLLAASIWALCQMFAAMPQRAVLQSASLSLQPGQAAVLGRQALAAPAADVQHLRVSRNAAGAWSVQNVSPSRAVEMRRDGHDELLRSMALQSTQHLLVAGQAWWIQERGDELVLEHRGSGRRWLFDGAVLSSAEGQAQPVCSDATISGRLRYAWNTHAPAWLRWPTALHWGGNVACMNYLPAAHLQPSALMLQRRQGQFWLSGPAAETRRVCLDAVDADGCDPGAALYEQSAPLDGVSHLVVGRTRFALQMQGNTLSLRPLRRSGWLHAGAEPPLLAVSGPQAAPGVASRGAALTWQTSARHPWRWPATVPPLLAAALAFAAAVAVAAVAHLRRWGPQPGGGLAMGLSLALAAASGWAYLVGPALGEAWSLALASLALATTVVLPIRTGWAWLSHVLVALMVSAGLALQLQLAAQALDTGGWAYFQKTAAMAAGGLFAAQALAWWLRGQAMPGARLHAPGLVTLEVALVLPAAAALALLALQAFFGAEEGVFGIQPVELTKLALVLLGAHALALRLEWARQGGWRRWSLWLRMVMPVLLFLALGATALLLLDDYSPLLLMAGWLVGATLAWCVAAGSWGAGVLLLLALAGTVQGVLWVQGDGLAWLQAHGFYGDRFAVWLEPLRHPHSGEQVLRAMRVASMGGLGGDALAPAWRVPAVQYDMAPAFFTGRFGVAAAAALLVVQLAYVGSLLMLGWQALMAAGPGDFRRRWGLRLVFFAAWGAAALFTSHLVLSWGTNTGALPVMGQPMPLLSAGSSVIAMLVAPLQMLWLLQPALLRGAATTASPRQ